MATTLSGRALVSVEDFGDRKEITSPRSIEACRRLGVVPDELYLKYAAVARVGLPQG